MGVTFDKDRVYSACQARKQVGVPHPIKNIMITTRPLELLHMDLFGLIAYISISGNKYSFVIMMIIPILVGYYFCMIKEKLKEQERNLQEEPKMSSS
jgi:hypothetical protein